MLTSIATNDRFRPIADGGDYPLLGKLVTPKLSVGLP